MEGQRWLPLEANPEVTNQFLKQLGLHPNWQFVDVYGMDPELLSMVPRPVCAVLLLFPITEKYEVFRTEEEEKIKSQGQDVTSSVYFMKQTISNACGTIGLIHAIANNKDKMHFESGSTLKKFLEESVSMSPEERARYLENYDVPLSELSINVDKLLLLFLEVNEKIKQFNLQIYKNLIIDYSLPFPPYNKYMPGNTLCVFHWEFGTRLKTNGKNKGLKAIRVTHETSAHEGQTEAPNIDEKVDLHFIALVHVDGHLYELDGRKPFPINHGETSDDTLLEDAIEVCKKFMERDPDELRFNAIALSAA